MKSLSPIRFSNPHFSQNININFQTVPSQPHQQQTPQVYQQQPYFYQQPQPMYDNFRFYYLPVRNNYCGPSIDCCYPCPIPPACCPIPLNNFCYR